jgi:hypothetical protein
MNVHTRLICLNKFSSYKLKPILNNKLVFLFLVLFVILVACSRGKISQPTRLLNPSSKFQEETMSANSKLFSEVNQRVEPIEPITPDSTVIRQRYVTVNIDLLRNSIKDFNPSNPEDTKVTLNLFDDLSLVTVLDKVETGSDVDFIWNGHVKDDQQSNVTLVVSDNTVTGDIFTLHGIYQIRPLKHNIHLISQINQSAFPND